MDNTKKYILAFLLVILCFFMCYLMKGDSYSGFNNNLSQNKNTEYAFSKQNAVSLNNTSDDMPPISSIQYGFNENRILNSIVSEGYFISSYKRTFVNRERNDYDVESRYSDFNHDFEQYRIQLKNHLIDLKSANPKLDDAKFEQRNTVEKVERLYNIISEYSNHNTNIKDTISYLKECEYELNRVSLQNKLPN